MLFLRYRSRLQVSDAARDRVLALDARRSIEDPSEARRTLPILLATILAFFFHKALGLEPATVALAGAAIMLLVTRQPLQSTIAGIEWPTLFFLIGLFVMVGALEHTGALDEVADGIASATGGDRMAELLGILWASALGSGLVDNIPFTAAMLPVVDELGGDEEDAYWWALSLGACFGGNLTIVAAAANVAASGMAARAGRPIGFLTFMKVGAPVTAVSLVLATGYVLLRYAMTMRTISDSVMREVEPLAVDDTVETAVRRLLELDVPALPAVDARGRYAGIFGEREFLSALFPGYLRELKGSAFLSRAIDDALEKRETCRAESVGQHLYREHVEVDEDFSDAELAEIFFHHRVLVVPVLHDGRVRGIVTRHEFFRAVGSRFLDRS